MGNYSREQVMEVIASVMKKAGSTQNQPLQHIHSELEALAETIESMHQDILATRSQDVTDKHIPTATDELDAVVGATEEASATIMDSCESIQEIMKDTDEATREAVIAETTKIFEACAFQDITGQRISKVVKTLKDIEASVNRLLELFGHADAKLPEAEDSRNEDEKLKNGPQLAGEGVTQDEIDKLLAEFE